MKSLPISISVLRSNPFEQAVAFAGCTSKDYLCRDFEKEQLMSTAQLSEQEIIRREKLAELQKLGIDPYPAASFPINISAADIKANFKGEENKQDFSSVCLAGRIMSIRDMGKASFAVIQDNSGRIQLYIKRDEICPGEDKTLYDKVWKHLTDIGDIIGVKGYVFTTKTGEISVHVSGICFSGKSIEANTRCKGKRRRDI